MFSRARFSLTFLYTLILLAISVTLSVTFYLRTVNVLEHQFAVIEQRLRHEQVMMGFSPRQLMHLRVLPEEMAEAKRKIVLQLVLINASIAVVFALAGYFLSGKTLEPVRLALEEQKRFLADAAHELKTPITALKTSLEVSLIDPNLTNPEKILRENLSEVNYLQELVESLLRLAKQEQSQPQVGTVVLTTLIQNALQQVQPLADEKEIKIQIENLAPQLSFQGELESLTSLLVILLDNAVKFSPMHSTVRLLFKQRGRELVFKVQDYGVGIAKEHLPHIFERFYRVDAARQRSSITKQVGGGGHGLGLSLAQRIVRQHRGKISVRSRLGRGTIFTVRLPLAQTKSNPFRTLRLFSN